MRKTLLISILTTISLVLSSCLNTTQNTDAPGVILAWGSEPQRPLLTTDTEEVGGGDIIDVLYTGLVEYAPDGTTELAVAKSIEPNEDNTRFDITLNEGITFHNGELVTADSFIDTWNYAANPENNQTQADRFAMIEGYGQMKTDDSVTTLSGLHKISDLEFVVQLTAPESFFPTRLGDKRYSPWPQVAFEDIKKFGEAPIGNGPYKLASADAWKHNVGISLVPFENYQGSRTVENNRGLNFVFYSSAEAAYIDIMTGNLDIMRQAPPSAASTYETDFPNTSAADVVAQNRTMTIPERLEHFHNDEEGHLRRQAISLSIDRHAIEQKIKFVEDPKPIVDFGSPGLGEQDPVPGREVLEYNPEKAKELWAQADKINPWSGKFVISYNADQGHGPWIESVANGISNTLGIQAEGKAYPLFRTLREEISSQRIETAFQTGWLAEIPSISNFLEPLYTTDGGSNDGKYSNPEFDELIAQAALESDPETVRELYAQAQAILMKELPAIPLWYEVNIGVWNEQLSTVDYDWAGKPVYTSITKD